MFSRNDGGALFGWRPVTRWPLAAISIYSVRYEFRSRRGSRTAIPRARTKKNNLLERRRSRPHVPRPHSNDVARTAPAAASSSAKKRRRLGTRTTTRCAEHHGHFLLRQPVAHSNAPLGLRPLRRSYFQHCFSMDFLFGHDWIRCLLRNLKKLTAQWNRMGTGSHHHSEKSKHQRKLHFSTAIIKKKNHKRNCKWSHESFYHVRISSVNGIS